MTISTETCAIQYTGNGIQTTFTYNFLIPRDIDGSAQVALAIVDSAGATTFVSPAGYTISGVGNPSGGVVVYPLFGAPIDSSTKLVILRSSPYEQLSAVNNQGFLPHSVEQIADNIVLQVQQLAEKANRSIQAPPGESMGFLPGAIHRAGLFLSFDGSGNPIAVAGTGGGGGTAWASITAKPPVISAIEGLTPAAGQIIEYTSAGSAHMIPTPSGGGGGGVNSVNMRTGNVVLSVADVDGSGFGAAVGATFAPGANMTITTVGDVTTFAASSGGGGGNMQPRLLSDYHAIDGGGVNTASNDLAITAAEAAGDSAVYVPDGIYATTLAESFLTKHYVGRGIFLFPGAANDAFPARYSNMPTKPSTWPTQGRTGWFRGDQRFTEQEYSVIGPNVRTYDLTARYYESNTIPHNSWLDIASGNSGTQAFLNAGANIGDTVIALPNPANAAWVGKTVGFGNYGGGLVESHVISAVNTAGNNITLTTPLTNAYVWNPAASLIPQIFFAPRTWGGRDYIKMICTGGGDFYGHNVRMNANYIRSPTETHTFMAGTYSQYGGDVYANADGLYLQSWESQLQGQTYDVSGLSFVQSHVRNVDFALDGGKFWAGTYMASTGTRPCDVAHDILGNWRNGMDTTFASMYETSRVITTGVAPGDTTVRVASSNGAHVGDTIQLGAEIHNILIVAANLITTDAAWAGTYAVNTLVTYSRGGAVLNMKLGQRHVWNSTISSNARSGDPSGVFPSAYGNVQGDIITESWTDGAGTDWWQARVARGATVAQPDIARIRVRGDHAGNGNVQIYGTGVHTINGTGLGLTGPGGLCNLNMTANSLLTLGPGCYIYSDGTHIYAHNAAGTTVTLV